MRKTPFVVVEIVFELQIEIVNYENLIALLLSLIIYLVVGVAKILCVNVDAYIIFN